MTNDPERVRSTNDGLTSALDARLAAYLATGGAMLAFASQAEAVVVGSNSVIPFGINGSVPIDLNADGEQDFEIDHDRDGAGNDFLQIDKNDQVGLALPGTDFADGGLPGINDQHEYLTSAQGNYPLALSAGTSIGPSSPGLFEFQESNNYLSGGLTRRANRLIDEDQGLADGGLASPPPGAANWASLGGDVGYLGLRIDFNNSNGSFLGTTGLNYGWVGVRITNLADGTGEVVGWGYETRPDTPIAAGVPEPGSIVMAVVGAAGLAVAAGWKKLRARLSA